MRLVGDVAGNLDQMLAGMGSAPTIPGLPPSLLGAYRAERLHPARALIVRADGLVPRLAQRLVILFFWPMRASSWNQISITRPRAGPSAISATAAGKFF